MIAGLSQSAAKVLQLTRQDPASTPRNSPSAPVGLVQHALGGAPSPAGHPPCRSVTSRAEGGKVVRGLFESAGSDALDDVFLREEVEDDDWDDGYGSSCQQDLLLRGFCRSERR